MKYLLFITTGFAAIMTILTACGNREPGSAYQELLNKAPYSAITDSIEKDPDNAHLYFRRAVMLNTNDLAEPALSDFRTAWNLQKTENSALGISTLLLESKPDSAIAFLESTLPLFPESFLLQLSLARAYDSKNRTDDALRICEKLLKLDSMQVDILKLKGALLDRQGKTAQAISVLEKAYAKTPFDIELNYILALKLAETGNSRVLSLCDSLIKADSLGIHAEPYYYKGIYYTTRNDKLKAIAHFDQAMRINIHFMEAYTEKGSLLYEMKKYPEALNVFNLALNISPDYADSYYWIAKCQEATGKLDEAKLNYERAYSLDKTNLAAKEAAEKIRI